jgi:hypothetical protein
MKFLWRDSPTHYRCTIDKPVAITINHGAEHAKITDMGYVIPRDDRFMACIYGSVNPDALGAWFDNIDEAKRYVEEQALIGLTLKKLEGNV